MKSATIPAVRVEPELREQIEALLDDGESLSEFVESSVRASVRRRQEQSEFMARGLASLDRARRVGDEVPASEVVAELRATLETARRRVAKRRA